MTLRLFWCFDPLGSYVKLTAESAEAAAVAYAKMMLDCYGCYIAEAIIGPCRGEAWPEEPENFETYRITWGPPAVLADSTGAGVAS